MRVRVVSVFGAVLRMRDGVCGDLVEVVGVVTMMFVGEKNEVGEKVTGKVFCRIWDSEDRQ
mgnify:FL=1